MKRNLFIIIGAVTLFLIFTLWLYLLLFGTPRTVSEVVGDFGFDDITATPITPADGDGTTRELSLVDGTLYQLTTRPVAGFGFARAGTSSVMALYAERGTGYVYQINLATGEETRLLQKTFVAINRAFFADDGSAVVLVGETSLGTEAHLEELDQDQTAHVFPENADNIDFLPGRELRYTIADQNGTSGHSYDLDTAMTDQLFSVALRDVRVIWDASEPLLYSRAAPALTGSLYRVAGDTLSRTGATGQSFSALANPEFYGLLVETYAQASGRLISFVRGLADDEEVTLGVTALPEKCVFDSLSLTTLWCAAPYELLTAEEQAAWYKGAVNFSDSLWKIDLETGIADQVENLFETSGREIDVIDMTTDDSGTYLLFKNKIEDTLWLKRLAAPNSELDATSDEDLLGDGEEVTDGEI